MAASVLYVDDDRNLCQIVAKALVSEGYLVRTCHDGDEALEVLREHTPNLVLLDLMLPRRDGFEVLDAIRNAKGQDHLRELPVIVLTGASPTPAYAQRANALKAFDLLSKPVPLDKLLTVVQEAIRSSKGPMTAQEEPSEAPSRRRRSSGTFDRVPFPALLHHLHGLRATGTLHLAHEKKRKWVQLRDGYPVSIRSNLVRETLGRYLERTRSTDAGVIEAARREADKQSVRHGEILVAMQILSEEEVTQALREQADEKFFEIFSWKGGTFRFERGSQLQRANAMGLGRSPASLILEGVRTRFPLDRIDRYLDRQKGRFVRHGESPFYRFQDLHIDPEHDGILQEIDGTQKLSRFTGRDERLRRTVYGLLAAGMLELQAKPSVVPERRSPAAATTPSIDAVEERVVDPPRRDARREDPRHAELMALADQLRAGAPHEVLGVAADASPEDVATAYERLAAHSHPDRFKDGSQPLQRLAEDVFGRVREAYETLCSADTEPPQSVGPSPQELTAKREAREAREHQTAEKAFQAEIEFRKGEDALATRNYETCLVHFGKALELYPEEGDYHAHYGYALHLCHPGDAGMVAEAMEHVKRGVKLASHREKPYLFLGRLHKAVGRADDAEKMFVRAVQIEPECLEALRELRLIQMRRDKSKGLIGRLLRR
ncbi:MAG: response regulator [Myxococcota bacterium]